MSLFVGNISKNIDQRQLEKAFISFGKCKIDKRTSYAFIEFDDEIDAEDAKNKLSGQDFGGLRINVEWSKRSGKYNRERVQT